MKVSSKTSARKRFRIARIGQVPVYINLSWLFFGALIVYLLIPQFQYRFEFEPLIAAWWGTVTAILFAFSVLIHELGHVVAAKTYKAPVHEVEINLLGGYTLYGGRNLRPLQEAVLSASGPAATFALAAVFWGISSASGTTVLAALTQILASLNFFLGIFNLLPVSTLDGGKIVESVIEHFTGNKRYGLLTTTICTAILLVGGLGYLVVTEQGRNFLTQPVMLIMVVLLAGFLITNTVRSWKLLSRQEALDSLSISTLLEEAPEFVRAMPLEQQVLVPYTASGEEILMKAAQTQSAYLVVINQHNQIGGVIRYQRIVDTIAQDERLTYLLGKDPKQR